jgi:hypothetical protein
MSETIQNPCIALTPQGHLSWHPADGEVWPLIAAAERVRDAFAINPVQGLLHLVSRETETQLPAGPSFWRSFARMFLTRFCHRPETDNLQQVTALLPDADLQNLVDHAPPMLGGEYLSIDVAMISLLHFLPLIRRVFPLPGRCNTARWVRRSGNTLEKAIRQPFLRC